MKREGFKAIWILLLSFVKQFGALQHSDDIEREHVRVAAATAASASGFDFDEPAVVRTADGRTNVRVTKNMDAEATARIICEAHSSADDSCLDISAQAIKKQQLELYGSNADAWTHNSICGCMLPTTVRRKPALQYLHVPKAGTSVNWFLRDYFGEACASEGLMHNTSGDRGPRLEDNPCPEWLHTSELMQRGLCGGRLFSCQGHRVRPDLPSQVLSRPNTYLLTVLRRPWERALSDFNHFLTNPTSQHLSPHVQAEDIIHGNFTSYLMHPGVANCATKMLTGRQCGEPVELQDTDLELAKRRGNYSDLFYSRLGVPGGAAAAPVAETDALPSEEGRAAFRRTYRFDIELYDFALELFEDRYSLTGCS